MYPENNYNNYPPANNNRNKWLLIGGVAFVLIVSMALIFRPLGEKKEKLNLPQHKLSQTNLKANENFGYLQGSDIYAYNGLAFYKVNLDDNNKVTVLSNGLKLPVPSSIFWANSRGALMNFKESFTYTKVEEQLRAKGAVVNDNTKSYTWYLDFATGTLRLAVTAPLIPGQVYYSEAERGFYYTTIPNEKSPATQLSFYHADTGRSEIISENLKATDIGNLTKCSKAIVICFTGRDLKDLSTQRLYGIDDNKQTKTIFNSDGRIFPTRNADIYITVSRGDTGQPIGGNNRVEQADYPDEPAVMRNIASGTITKLDFDIGMSGIIAHFKTAEDFYILDSNLSEEADNTQTKVYRAGHIYGDQGKTETHPLTFTNGTAFKGSLIDITSHGSDGRSLLANFDTSQLLFSTSPDSSNIKVKSGQETQLAINDCAKPLGGDSQYLEQVRLYRVLFTDDTQFSTKIREFSKCMAQKHTPVLLGHNFQFAATDPYNGRLTTD